MSDTRTKLDILYKDALGDIHEIMTRVESVKADIDKACGDATGRLNLQVSQMLATSNEIGKLITGLAEGGKAQVIKQLNSSKQEFVDEMMKTTRAAAIDAGTAAVKQAVGSQTEALLASVASSFQQRSNELKTIIDDAKKAKSIHDASFMKLAILSVSAAVLVGCMVIGAYYFLKPDAVNKAEAERNALAVSTLREAAPLLDKKSQNILRGLMPKGIF